MMRHRNSAILLAGIAFFLSFCGCTGVNPRVATSLNQNAGLTGDLPSNPLKWKIITSLVDKTDRHNSTMAMLYGNDVAVQFARANSGNTYPNGSVLSLVTWNQQEDPRWFGAKIPDAVKSVEFVIVGASPDHSPAFTYQKYEGSPLKKVSSSQGAADHERAAYLLSQRAAVMP